MTAIDGEASSARLAGDLLALARLYAPPSPLTDPLAIIVWDNVGYLIADNRREALFNELVDRVGLSAEALVAAPYEVLFDIAQRGGMRPEVRVERLRAIGRLTLDAGGDLATALRAAGRHAAATEGGAPSHTVLDTIQSERWARIFRPLAFADVLEMQAKVIRYQAVRAAKHIAETAASTEAAPGRAKLAVKRTVHGSLRDNYISAYLQVTSLPEPLRNVLLHPNRLAVSASSSGPIEAEDSSTNNTKKICASPWGVFDIEPILRSVGDASSLLQEAGRVSISADLQAVLRDVPPPELFEAQQQQTGEAGEAEARSRRRSRDETHSFLNLR